MFHENQVSASRAGLGMTFFVNQAGLAEGKSVRFNAVPVFLCMAPSVPRLLSSLWTET